VASCPPPVTLSSDRIYPPISGLAVDHAGNAAVAVIPGIRIDKTAPTIVAAATTADGAPYTGGTWATQSVTVSFTCADALSGVASCPAPTTGITRMVRTRTTGMVSTAPTIRMGTGQTVRMAAAPAARWSCAMRWPRCT